MSNEHTTAECADALDQLEKLIGGPLMRGLAGKGGTEALLALLPVVRAANALIDEDGSLPGGFCNTVIHMRRALRQSRGAKR